MKASASVRSARVGKLAAAIPVIVAVLWASPAMATNWLTGTLCANTCGVASFALVAANYTSSTQTISYVATDFFGTTIASGSFTAPAHQIALTSFDLQNSESVIAIR